MLRYVCFGVSSPLDKRGQITNTRAFPVLFFNSKTNSANLAIKVPRPRSVVIFKAVIVKHSFMNFIFCCQLLTKNKRNSSSRETFSADPKTNTVCGLGKNFFFSIFSIFFNLSRD